ncbi:hypothetical protein LTR17_014927 [Elasticomyces elasticus]|nr:hypothetical protein LTR17_014927 [Elasticomyces elasticus]
MWMIYSALSAAILTARALAAPTNNSAPQCHDFMLDVPVVATTYVLDILRVNNNIDAVNYALDIDGRTSKNATERVLGTTTISDTFTVKATFCTPSVANDKHILQILTHGLVVDSRYWDIEIDRENYSYVQAAVDAGYSVLNYDRLGHGQSQKPDAYTVVQGPLEVEILRGITEMARNGAISSPALPFVAPPFETVVHVGHSYGSFLTSALLVAYPELSSGAILTGYTITNSSAPGTSTVAMGFQYAAANNPGLFGDRGSGYIVPASISQVQTGFYHRKNESDPAGFTDDLLAYGEHIKQPLTVAEWVTIHGLLNLAPAPAYKGPLQFFLAENDYLLCASDCKADYDLTILGGAYPAVSDLDVYLQPGAGHGLTFHKNATAGYAVMMDFLAKNNL